MPANRSAEVLQTRAVSRRRRVGHAQDDWLRGRRVLFGANSDRAVGNAGAEFQSEARDMT